jgi:hypothetical protein
VVKDQNERRIASDPDLDAGTDVAISAGLAAAMDSGELALAHLLVGAFMQAAMVVARAADLHAATESMAASMHRLLDGLRP